MPDSHKAGDFGNFLVGAHHPYGMSLETLNRAKTDAHLDTNEVRAGAVLVDSSLIQLFIWLFF